MHSIWEKNHWLKADIIIVGAGIVGLSTAISLKESQPDLDILILERGLLPSGASTKNAGFACFGSLSELCADLSKQKAEEVFQLVEQKWKGLEKLRMRLGERAIGFQFSGGYELVFEENPTFLDEMTNVNNLLSPIFKDSVFSVRNDLISKHGFNNQVKSLIFNPFEGYIDTGLMMRALYALAQRLGIRVFTGADVHSFEDSNSEVTLQIQNHLLGGLSEFKANKVVFCTNAFSRSLFPEFDVSPGRGQIVVTKPIPNLKLKGAFHFDEGYFYFRDYENRVLFGGGRNHFFDEEKTTQFGLTSGIQDLLLYHLKHTILPNQDFEIDFAWSGIMAFGPNKSPIIKKTTKNTIAGVRLGGMGVAIGTTIGEQLATMILRG